MLKRRACPIRPLGLSTAELVSSVATEVLSSAAKETVGVIAGPVLRTLLLLTDRHGDQLGLVLATPLLTGLREARYYIGTSEPADANDANLRAERLQHADAMLAQALTVGEQKRNEGLVVYLWTVRGLIARSRGAHGQAAKDLHRAYALIDARVNALSERREEVSEQNLRRAKRDLAAPHSAGAFLPAQAELKDLSARLKIAIQTRNQLEALQHVASSP